MYLWIPSNNIVEKEIKHERTTINIRNAGRFSKFEH